MDLSNYPKLKKYQFQRRAIMRWALNDGVITPSDLVREFNWSLSRASIRLIRLYRSGWFRRKNRDTLYWDEKFNTREKEYSPSEKLENEFRDYPDPDLDVETREHFTDKAFEEMCSNSAI